MENSSDYEQYDRACEKIRTENEELIHRFECDLKSKGLASKTINSHVENVTFYLNTYLLRSDAISAKDGWQSFFITNYLGYFFIRKCMWSTPASIKANCASLKKFYAYMANQGLIEKAALDETNACIRENINEWMKECRKFNGIA